MDKIFADNAMRYYDNGYNILPLEPLTKAIKINDWPQWCEEKQPDYLVQGWINSFSNHNIGIPLGPASGIVGIDFDYDEEGIHEKVQALIEGSLVRKQGMKGFTAFYKYSGEHSKRWYKNGKACVELLSTGTQTVVPPSIHPDTRQPYKWLTLDTLCDVKAEDLSPLPENFIEKVNELFGYKEKLISFQNTFTDLPELAEVEKALGYIPSDDYATWITVGMALQQNYDDAAFLLWDAWSRKAGNYNPKVMNKKWASFGRYMGTRVTIGTIFHWAIGHGYIPHSDVLETKILFDDIDTSTGQRVDQPQPEIQQQAPAPIIDSMEFPVHLLENAPGMPGELARWINSTSMYRQPVLSLGAAICASGTLFAHRIKSDSNLRTNFMVLGLAGSGAGKEHARDCIKSLFYNLDLQNLTFGNFTADVALINALDGNNGVGIALMDEIGREIKALTARNAGGHEARLLTCMMEMFSQAGTYYDGKRYANTETAKKIVQPCLNIYGTTVPKSFFDAMTSNEAIDGFLARWIIFESTDINPLMQKMGNIDDIPVQLLENIKYIRAMRVMNNTDPYDTSTPVPCPTVIPFTDSANDILHNFTNTCNEHRLVEVNKNSGLDSVWARTRAHAIKLALVSHNYRDAVIDSFTMAWACELAMYLSTKAIKIIKENVTDTQHEQILRDLFNVINKWCQRNPGQMMPANVLCNMFRKVDPRKRNELLHQLWESNMIQITEIPSSSNNKSMLRYYKTI